MLTKEGFWDKVYRLNTEISIFKKLRCKRCMIDRERKLENLRKEYRGIYI